MKEWALHTSGPELTALREQREHDRAKGNPAQTPLQEISRELDPEAAI